MKKFIKYPPIEQFRKIIRDVSLNTRFVGLDDNGKPIYDGSIKLPVIEALAVEKIHGTNASVCYNNESGFWVQKRSGIVTPEKDNAECALYAERNKEVWISLIKKLSKHYDIDLNNNTITIYYEWCGGNIQKKSAVSDLEKMAIIFRHFKVTEHKEDTSVKWLETNNISSPDYRIFNICDFPTYPLTIDFSQPLLVQNQMIDIVEKVIETNSPVGRQLGIDGNIGEGIVVSFILNDNLHMFKVKGEKHSASKVKTLKPVDNEHLMKVIEVAQKVSPAWRFEQMFNEANDIINGCVPEMKNMGTYMRLINQDILKEDADLIIDAGLEHKEVMKEVSKLAREFYQRNLYEF